MTPAASDPTKRVPKSLGTETKLFGRYTLTDVGVGLLPAVIVTLVTQTVLSPSLEVFGYPVQSAALPLTLGAVAVGVLLVAVTPAHTTSLEWLFTIFGYQTSEHRLEHDEAARHTGVERVHVDRGAIERTDGALVGMVRVDPPSMALATDAEWTQTAEAFQDVLNTTVEFPIQIHSATRPFPVENHLAHYERRREDPDVRSNPRLRALIDNYLAWYRESLDERRMTIREHYVVVPVTPAEIQFEREGVLATLAGVPLLGTFVRAWFRPERPAQQQALFTTLDERLRRIEGALRGVDGCEAWQVDAPDAAQVVATFWKGSEAEYGDPTSALRTRPIGGQRR